MRRQSKRPAENIYLKGREIPPEQFLHLIDGRDTPEFRATFATWLSDGCKLSLVRSCFSAEPDRYADELRAKWRAQQTVLKPDELRRKIDKSFQQSEVYRREYVNHLLEHLRPLPCWQQVAFLDQRLRAIGRQEMSRRPRGASRRRLQGTTNKPPESIYLEQVQDDYYWHFPPPHKRIYRNLVFEQELGEKLARKLARKDVPDEGHYLHELAQELRCRPQRGDGPLPVWAELSNYPIYRLLLCEFAMDPGRLRRTIKSLCSAYLRKLLVLQADRFAQRRTFLKDLRSELQGLAGGDPEFLKRVRLIHRVARYNRDIMSALREFFLHGLDPDALRLHRGLAHKVINSTFPADVALLARFTSALLHQWQRDDADGSPYRIKLAQTQTWPWQVAQRQAGLTEAQFSQKVEQLAGVPQASTEAVKRARLTAFAKRRARGFRLHYPNPKATTGQNS
jgi:hypothetical protein